MRKQRSIIVKCFLFLFLSAGLLHAASTDKVGIVGGGASGLLAAYLLDQNFDVTLFDKQDRFGGHAKTVKVKFGDKYYGVDAGFEFFSSAMQPTLVKLLNILAVTTKAFPLTHTFFTEDGSNTVVMPPIVEGCLNPNACSLTNLRTLAQFAHALSVGQTFVGDDTSITLKEFADKNPALFSSVFPSCSSFYEDFFFPLIAGGWMISVDEVKASSAYNMLKWLNSYSAAGASAEDLYEVVDGTGVYIEKLVDQLKDTNLSLNSDIDEITYKDGKYTVLLISKKSFIFDHLIIATNAYEANKLLASIPHAQEVRSHLSHMKYKKTIMALHGDMSYMPQDEKSWSMMNVRFNKDMTVCSSVYKPWGTPDGYPVLRTCISYAPNIPLPKPLYGTEEFYHPLVTPEYFQAQKDLRPLQGKNNLWLAGLYIEDTDSHESALRSAIGIAQRLSPSSKRLLKLTTTELK